MTGVHEIDEPILDPDDASGQDQDFHRNSPQGDSACLYGLIGEVARAGSEGNETNPYAIAANFLTYLSCAVGRGVYLQVGNTEHHPRLFSLHIGRSGRGRKGDSLALVLKINDAVQALDPTLCPQIHRGGLSSREGLATLIHDGFQHGNREVPAITDKRLWVVESEFANVLQQSRRQGNTLSTALRDCWDGVCIKPATKSNRIFASRPHVCLSGAITPNELTGLMSTKDLSNGFANRFLMIWAERTRITAFPKATPQSTVEHLAQQTHAVLTFANASNHLERNHTPMELSPGAKWHYGQLYRDVLCQDLGNDRVTAILERRAPLLLRLGMLFALCDVTTRIEVEHLDAALAWIRYFTDSVQYVFLSAKDERLSTKASQHVELVLNFLNQHQSASRSDIVRKCFQGHLSKMEIDTCLDHLLGMSPPKIQVEVVARADGLPGGPARIYSLANR